MIKKNQNLYKWPLVKGDYLVGNNESCVSVVTCGSHLDNQAIIKYGAAICGSCKTENLGIEKLITHIVLNNNIRYLIVTGEEVRGHLTGESILMLHKNGVLNKKIVGSNGAIPYLENISIEKINHFRKQVIYCIDLLNVDKLDTIKEKIDWCLFNDPGCYEKKYVDLIFQKKNIINIENTLNNKNVIIIEKSKHLLNKIKEITNLLKNLGNKLNIYYEFQLNFIYYIIITYIVFNIILLFIFYTID